jgi:hypothetical protein
MTYEFKLPVRQQELVRLIALGDYSAVRDTINQLGALGYTDPNKWTKLMPTGREGEYISIHTRRYAPPIT